MYQIGFVTTILVVTSCHTYCCHKLVTFNKNLIKPVFSNIFKITQLCDISICDI